MDIMKHKWIWTAAAIVALVICYMMWTGKAFAADLGGNCCADLEERIAELEASVARKGNRKVSLTVYGQVSRSITMWDDQEWTESLTFKPAVGPAFGPPSNKWTERYGGTKVGHDNSNAESRVGFAGKAKINGDVSAGFVLELGVGEYEELWGSDTDGINVRKSYVFIKSAKLGQVTLGKASDAMDGIDKLSTANVDVATRPLSMRPLVGPIGAEPFDGHRRNLLRYDSPLLSGFQASASWSANDTGMAGPDEDTDLWEVALRYAGEFQDVRVVGGIGYGSANDGANDKLEATLSLMHVPSGIFVTGNYGWAESLGGYDDVTGYAGMVGIESKLTKLGKTTVYAEYAYIDGDAVLWSGMFVGTASLSHDQEETYYGGGIVQAIDQAAMDLFVSFRVYEGEYNLDGKDSILGSFNYNETMDNWLVGSVGARVKF